MEIGSMLFILAMLLLVGAYVARPLSEPAPSGVGPANPKLSRLQAQRERVLDAIQELDADHALGKVLAEDYRLQRQQLAMQGATVLKRIDELASTASEPGLEAELEARVAKLKQQQPSDLCSACGTAAVPGDRFCSNCGTPLREQGA